jgi:Family of unknown function (DUF6719)
MKTLLTVLATLILVAAGRGSCNAQIVVKKEPLDMRNGSTVLVDDGTCGKGMLKLVTVTHGNAMPGAPLRATKCVPR